MPSYAVAVGRYSRWARAVGQPDPGVPCSMFTLMRDGLMSRSGLAGSVPELRPGHLAEDAAGSDGGAVARRDDPACAGC